MDIFYDNIPILARAGLGQILSGGAIKIHPSSAVSPIWGAVVTIPIDSAGLPEQVPLSLPNGDYCVAYLSEGELAGSRPTCNWLLSVDDTMPATLTPQQLLDSLTPAATYRQSYAAVKASLETCQRAIAVFTGIEAELTAAKELISRYEAIMGTDITALELAAQIEKLKLSGESVNQLRPDTDCAECEPQDILSLVKAPAIAAAITRPGCERKTPEPFVNLSKRSPRTRRRNSFHSTPVTLPDKGMDIHALLGSRKAIVPPMLKDCSVDSPEAASGAIATTATTVTGASVVEGCDLLC